MGETMSVITNSTNHTTCDEIRNQINHNHSPQSPNLKKPIRLKNIISRAEAFDSLHIKRCEFESRNFPDICRRFTKEYGRDNKLAKTCKDFPPALATYILHVVENEITEEQLHHITENLLKELGPQIGPRMVLVEKFSKFKALVVNFGIDENLNHRECSMTTFAITGDESISGTSSSAFSGAPQSDPIVITTAGDTNDDIIFEGNNLYDFLRTKFEDFDLKTLLVTSPLGKSILNYYATYRNLYVGEGKRR